MEWEALRGILTGSAPRAAAARPRRDWPPAGARHDAIESKALASWWNPPEGYAGGRDARPRIAELAEEGLTELAAFRRRSPETTHEIEEPLREYEARLRQVAEHPESRTFKGWPR